MAVLLVLPFGCSDDQSQIVPYVRVGFYVNLDLPQFNSLTAVNNAVIYAEAGYNRSGVIVYRYLQDEFFAFDATCPQHIEDITAVKLDGGGSAGTATCPKCGTVYYLSNYGYPAKGYPLKRYNVNKSGNMLYVSN
ncbi:MAG: hypothetical protein AB9846_01390 [Tenuifilaceae bacterium]